MSVRKRCGWRCLAVLVVMATSPGCAVHVVSSRGGPARTDVLGVSVEFAPDLGGDGPMAVTTSTSEPSATDRQGDGPMAEDLLGKSASVGYGAMIVDITDGDLKVNGRSYGSVKKGDRVYVEKDKVRVNDEVRKPAEG